MKKAWILLLALTLILSLAACGGNENNIASGSNGNNGGEGSGEPEEITLRIAWWGSQPRHDYTLKVIEMYEEQNPHVKIEPEYASWDDYWKRLAPQASANELPDIIQMDLSYISQYGGRGQLADLTPYLNKEIDISDISDTVVSGGKLGDKLYGFNLGVNAIGFHYDPELLKKTGVESIPEDWTWDDYYELAGKAKDAGVYMDTRMRPEVFFAYYLRTKGSTLYAADGTSLGYEDDRLFIDFFQPLTELVKEGAIPSPDYVAQVKGIEDDPVVKGNAIGIWQWSNQFVGLQSVADRPFAMQPMPGPGLKEGMFLKPSMYFSVSENSKHKEEAAKFINFFVNDVEANKLILGERGVPGSNVVKEALKPLLSEQQVQVFDYVSWVEQNSSQMDPPDPVGAAEIMTLLGDLVEQMDYEQISAEDAAAKFRKDANNILSRNK
ncbi:ABC transporter substrate-binding protein [Marinicrinis lubricantis]|uniref:ABC transporter substrate-binding protein n=1 Tax=Marinicrinis lubricantis TaxID=2086470 RepID=A0ABW1ISP2_9BACL